MPPLLPVTLALIRDSMRSFTVFTLTGVKTTISPVGIVSFLVAIPLLAWLAGRFLPLALGPALLAGALSAAMMFVSEWLHQMGHALAARRVGYPMIGIQFHSPLSTSVYPADEPRLPPQTHIRRALGGFWVNLLTGLLLGLLAVYLWPRGGVAAWLAGFSAVYNFFVLGLGALTPIDIPGVLTVDGGTLLRYWREERARAGKRRSG